MNNEILTITFSTVTDLLSKVEKIKEFAVAQKELRRKQFNELGITYEELNEFGFAIDISKNTEEQLLAMKNLFDDNTFSKFVKELEQ